MGPEQPLLLHEFQRSRKRNHNANSTAHPTSSDAQSADREGLGLWQWQLRWNSTTKRCQSFETLGASIRGLVHRLVEHLQCELIFSGEQVRRAYNRAAVRSQRALHCRVNDRDAQIGCSAECSLVLATDKLRQLTRLILWGVALLVSLCAVAS